MSYADLVLNPLKVLGVAKPRKAVEILKADYVSGKATTTYTVEITTEGELTISTDKSGILDFTGGGTSTPAQKKAHCLACLVFNEDSNMNFDAFVTMTKEKLAA